MPMGSLTKSAEPCDHPAELCYPSLNLNDSEYVARNTDERSITNRLHIGLNV